MRYIGSKLSLLDFIYESITSVVGNNTNMIFADLFAGTGAVGRYFKQKGYSVISNDLQYYSYIINKHYIENIDTFNLNKYTYLNELKAPADINTAFIYNNYCMGSGSQRNYFTNENGLKCDAIRQEIEQLYNNKEINESEYICLLASLIESVDKCANTTSVYGAFLKHIKSGAQKTFSYDILPLEKGLKGQVYNENANDLIKHIQGDILYLDPPYNARQYSSNYHILETIARYDNPEIKGKTGLRDYSKQKSDFCSVKTAEQALEDIIQNANFKYIFLSYNNEGLISTERIKEIMEKYGKYQVFTKEYKRYKADKEENRNYKADKTIEYLHCLVKN